ncbi:ATP-binding protein [Nonomuraea sp. NPDC002799]
MTTELALLPRVSFQGREITGARLHGLLALLAGDLRTGCSAARLVEGLWPAELPERPGKALHVLVSRARAQLGHDVIASTATGYRLSLREGQVDAAAVLLSASASGRHARAGDHAAALTHAEAGLALWEGTAGDDPGFDDPLSALRAERAATYRTLWRARALALSRLGRSAEVTGTLEELFHEHPRDEEVLLELLRSEAVTVGPPAALTRYDGYRLGLREELGADPGPALRAEHQRLLRGEVGVVRHGVSYEPNPLVGRDADLVAVAALLSTSRLTSIVGTGGLGKTRLAHAVSRRAEQPVVHFVALAGVTGDADVTGEVASALGIGPAGLGADAVDGIINVLGSGPALLVLDNCEHVVGGVAELVRVLLAATGELRVLTTSRAPLGLSSESVYPLPELDPVTTVELFIQRAKAARPGADLSGEVVAALCRRLDGLPLAVELAAARVRVMSVAEIARKLADRFALLRGGTRDAPPRHHTLHAVVDWSWNLLTPAGQAAMRALSVFPGGFTAGAAHYLLGDADGVLEALVDQSLLKVSDTESGTRFRMLETVREFSAERREAAGESGCAVAGFLDWARDFGRAHHESLFGDGVADSVVGVRAEQDNLVHALRSGLAAGDRATVAATAAVLAGLWTVEADHLRMMRLMEETVRALSPPDSPLVPPPVAPPVALPVSPPVSPTQPGSALVETARTALTLCALSAFISVGPRATSPLSALRRLPPSPPDTLIRAAATVMCADPARLPEWSTGAEPLLAGVAGAFHSYVHEQADDLDGALAVARRMLTAFEQRGNPWIVALARSRIGELCVRLERPKEARRELRAALPVLEELGARPRVLQTRWGIILSDLQLGYLDEAARELELATQSRADDALGPLLPSLGAQAEIHLARGEIDAGLRLWRRAVERLRHAESPAFPLDPPGLEPWTLEAQAAAVVAHAQHGRLEPVAELVGELPGKLRTLLAEPLGAPAPYQVDLPVCGALLLALAMVDIATGKGSGARMVALAERFRYLRTFQPTMSSTRARQAAVAASSMAGGTAGGLAGTAAGAVAYADAVAAYAGLSRDELRGAALAALRAR